MIPTTLTPFQIVKQIAERHSVGYMALKRSYPHAGQPRLVLARSEAMAALRIEFQWSYQKIGQYFGGYHHTSVMDAIKRRVGNKGICEIGPRDKPKGVTNRTIMRELELLRLRIDVLVRDMESKRTNAA